MAGLVITALVLIAVAILFIPLMLSPWNPFRDESFGGMGVASGMFLVSLVSIGAIASVIFLAVVGVMETFSK